MARRMILLTPGLAILVLGARIHLFRYRLGQRPTPLAAWTMPFTRTGLLHSLRR